MKRLASLVLALIAVCCLSAGARAQGILININPGEHVALPRPIIIYPPHHRVIHAPPQTPQSSYKIKELAVQVKLADQVARTQVSQSFVNTGSTVMEVCFVFPLPYDGAVDQLTLLIDGKEFPAKLLPAAEARKMYEDIVRKNQDPALLEWMGGGLFKTSVFPVPPGAERKVTMRYSQVCRNEQGLTDYVFPLSTAKYTSHPVEKVEIEVAIESGAEIKNVYSPSHAVEIKRADEKHATVKFTSNNQVPTSDFRLLYDVGKGKVGTSVLSYRPDGKDDGYFLLLTSPEIKAANEDRPKKTVVFACDRSGSMSGKKFEQAKGALKFVLNNLREGDLFNIVAYDSHVESFRPELQKFDEEARKSALGFIEGLYAGGSTNIDGALRTALGQLKDSSRPNFVIFLTDGLPTDGEINEAKIVANSKSNNAVRARVFAFGVGYDVNSRLLDKLVRTNYGQSEYVRPDENIETSVSSLYNRIGSPVLTDLGIKFDLEGATAEQGPAVTRVYPNDAHDLFAGEQLVLVGRYKRFGAAKVTVSGKVGDKQQSFDFPAKLVEKSNDETNAFIEKLWAVRRVGEILDELDLKGKNEELVKELVHLATKHGVLTPYTSFIADESTNRHDLASNAGRAGSNLQALDATSGREAFEQRKSKQDYQRAAGAAAPVPYHRTYHNVEGSASKSTPGSHPISAPNAEGDKDAGPMMQNIGRKTFYRSENRWVDSGLTKEQEKNATQIERFSKPYFDLIDKHGQDAAKYMNFDEPVVVELGGVAYAF